MGQTADSGLQRPQATGLFGSGEPSYGGAPRTWARRRRPKNRVEADFSTAQIERTAQNPPILVLDARRPRRYYQILQRREQRAARGVRKRLGLPHHWARIPRYTGGLAQLGERLAGSQKVSGSSPLSSTWGSATRRKAPNQRGRPNDLRRLAAVRSSIEPAPAGSAPQTSGTRRSSPFTPRSWMV